MKKTEDIRKVFQQLSNCVTAGKKKKADPIGVDQAHKIQHLLRHGVAQVHAKLREKAINEVVEKEYPEKSQTQLLEKMNDLGVEIKLML